MTAGYAIKNASGTVIGRVLRWQPKLIRNRVSGTTYGGAYYSQTIGTPADMVAAHIYTDSIANTDTINRAEANGDELTVEREGTRYHVFVDGQPAWAATIRGKLYEADITLAVKTSEVIT